MSNPIEQGLTSRIQEVLGTRPAISRTQINRYKLQSTFTLPYGSSIVGSLMYPVNVDREIALHIDSFDVNENMREQGIGTKLLKAITADAKKNGATFIYGYVSNEAAIRTRAKVFGKDNLTFYSHYGVFTGESLDKSYDEIVARNWFPLYVVSDLNTVDTTGWE